MSWLSRQPVSKKRFKVANKLEDFQQFVEYLCSVTPCIIGFEATGNYHRAIAYYLQSKGFELRLISSLASSKCVIASSRSDNCMKSISDLHAVDH